MKKLKPGKIPGAKPRPKLKPLTPGRLPGQPAPDPEASKADKPKGKERTEL